MLRTRTLTTIKELEAYAELYRLKSGVSVSLSYLQCSHVRVFYRSSSPHKWIGGYVQNGKGDLRYFQAFSSERKVELLAQIGVNAADILETGCTFIDRLAPTERHQIYIVMILEAYFSQKPVLLGGAVVRQIQNYQMQTMPHLLFEESMVFGGKVVQMKQYYAFRNEFLSRSLRLLVQECKWVLKNALQKKMKRYFGGQGTSAHPSVR